MTKRKADCTPEEWARIRAQDRAQKQTPKAKERIRAYLREYSKSPKGRAKDKARYNEKRKNQITANARRRKYGLTPELEAELMQVQDRKCGICAQPLVLEGRGTRHCHVDHDHESGLVRGFLCGRCNVAEGFIRSLGLTPAEFATKVQAYLDSPPADRTKTGCLWS